MSVCCLRFNSCTIAVFLYCPFFLGLFKVASAVNGYYFFHLEVSFHKISFQLFFYVAVIRYVIYILEIIVTIIHLLANDYAVTKGILFWLYQFHFVYGQRFVYLLHIAFRAIFLQQMWNYSQ